MIMQVLRIQVHATVYYNARSGMRSYLACQVRGTVDARYMGQKYGMQSVGWPKDRINL